MIEIKSIRRTVIALELKKADFLEKIFNKKSSFVGLHRRFLDFLLGM